MSLNKLCKIHIDHEYYNSDTSNLLEMNLIPSVESTKLIKNNRIVIKKGKKTFSLYGDIYNKNEKLKNEFTLNFALTVTDPWFHSASNLSINKCTYNQNKTEVTLKEGNTSTAYYFHNKRNVMESIYSLPKSEIDNLFETFELNYPMSYLFPDAMECLSKEKQVGDSDLVYLNPLRFRRERLKRLNNLKIVNNDNSISGVSNFFTIENPLIPDHKNRILEVDLSSFNTGLYQFVYISDGQKETVKFYLNNQFYALKPFAVIDLHFNNLIHDNFKLLNKDVYISFSARKSFWRYYIIMKYNIYKCLKICSGNFSLEGTEKTMKSGEKAVVFKFPKEQTLKQVSDESYQLNGIHVETLDNNFMGDDCENVIDIDNNDSSDEIIKLPKPKVENLVIEKKSGSENSNQDEYIFYSDLYFYI
jgi:hypothetical protein